ATVHREDCVLERSGRTATAHGRYVKTTVRDPPAGNILWSAVGSVEGEQMGARVFVFTVTRSYYTAIGSQNAVVLTMDELLRELPQADDLAPRFDDVERVLGGDDHVLAHQPLGKIVDARAGIRSTERHHPGAKVRVRVGAVVPHGRRGEPGGVRVSLIVRLVAVRSEERRVGKEWSTG